MAQLAKGRSRRVGISPKPYRQFKDYPTSFFIEEILAHIRDTGAPESCDLLCRNPISRSAKFRIIRHIDIDQRKRVDGDMADCPMCTPNRFLSGELVWLPELQCCAVIGHCCADKEARDEADREFKQRSKRDYEEEYLLRGLPLMPHKAAVLKLLRSPAEESRRIFRKFRREVPTVHKHLRDLKSRKGGYLILHEILTGAEEEMESDYVGPAGFRGRGGSEVNSRDIEFGVLAGMTAVSQDYNPVKDLAEIERALESLGELPTEEAVMDFICAMDERKRGAAVAILRIIDSRHAKFVEKATDFARFFSEENIARIHAYGTHTLNPFSIEAQLDSLYGQRLLTVRHKDEISKLMLPLQMHDIDHPWPVAPEPDKGGNT